jgi:pimeloyl-ACP methyl ester carboxylesterase
MPTVKTNGNQIAYTQRGQGEPLVLIMGLGASGALWENHVQAYEKHFRCILVDNRGAGGSDKPAGPYTTKMMADDTAGLMDALGIRQARVAGISMGSAIAQELALAYPDKVRSLVLISSWAKCDQYMRIVFEHFKRVRRLVSPSDFVQLLQLWIFTAGYFESHQADLLQGQRDAEIETMPQAAFEGQCDACMTHDTLDRLARIAAPALITVGSADIFTPLRLSEEMHRRMPASTLRVFDGWGHCHHWEDLSAFNAATIEFLLNH